MYGPRQFLVLILLISACQIIDGARPVKRYRGEPCQDEGTCTIVKHCRSALQMIKTYRRHNLTRCEYEGRNEVVCCKDEDIIEDDNKENGIKLQPLTRQSELPNAQFAIAACEKYTESLSNVFIDRIIDGDDAIEGEFPHMVALGYDNPKSPGTEWKCGGTLISDQWIVTAAHCVQPSPTRILMGVTHLDDRKSTIRNVELVTSHLKYNELDKSNDIALIKMDRPVKFTDRIRPACLFPTNDNPAIVTATGWGITNTTTRRTSRVLQKVDLTSMEIQKCGESLKNRGSKITLSNFCAYSPNGEKDTCLGDSGGPLSTLHKGEKNLYYVVAVTNYGYTCGEEGSPSVYQRIYSHLNWISNIVWPKKK